MKGQPPLQYAVPQKRKLAWRECGEGPALVFVHGMGVIPETGKPNINTFLAGFGLSVGMRQGMAARMIGIRINQGSRIMLRKY